MASSILATLIDWLTDWPSIVLTVVCQWENNSKLHNLYCKKRCNSQDYTHSSRTWHNSCIDTESSHPLWSYGLACWVAIHWDWQKECLLHHNGHCGVTSFRSMTDPREVGLVLYPRLHQTELYFQSVHVIQRLYKGSNKFLSRHTISLQLNSVPTTFFKGQIYVQTFERRVLKCFQTRSDSFGHSMMPAKFRSPSSHHQDDVNFFLAKPRKLAFSQFLAWDWVFDCFGLGVKEMPFSFPGS
mgnify:CR=1 FL=1